MLQVKIVKEFFAKCGAMVIFRRTHAWNLWKPNKIRMLEDPYPNTYLKTKDGKKIKIKYAQLS